MALSLIINGNTYLYPETGEFAWGPDATDWAAAVTAGMLQKSGGLFQLLGEVDFGTGYGLKSLYYKSRTALPAVAGQIRLANTDLISFRNAANTADLSLSISGTNELLFNGTVVNLGGGIWGSIVGTLSSQTDLQNALNLKANLASPTFTGTVAGITKSMVGLSNVDNTSDVNKPVSIAQATADALNLKILSNLSDLNNVVTARTNLGLGTLATQSGTFSGTSSGTNTGDQTISLTGGVTGSGTGSFAATVVTNANLTGDVTSVGNATTLTNAPVIAKVLTGYTSGAGTVVATDSILQAIQKLNGNDATNANLTGDVTSVGNATSYSATVPLNKGGTGQVTKAAAFDALSPMTLAGDIIIGSTAGTGIRLAPGSLGYVLAIDAGTGLPTWTNAGAGDMILASVQTVTGAKSFNFDKLILKNATATWTTTLNSVVTGASNTVNLPTSSGTLLLNLITTQGDLIVGTSAGAATRLGTGTAGQFLSSQGAGNDLIWATAPTGDMTLAGVQTVTGAKTFGTIGGTVGKFILAGSTSGSSILNAAAVAGTTTFTLPTTSGTVSLNPMTTGGDIVYGGASGLETRLANGSAGNYLKSNGTTLAPSWASTAGFGDMFLGTAQAVTADKTFSPGTLKIAGATSGTAAIACANIAGTATFFLPSAGGIGGTISLNPMTTLGDIVYGGVSGVETRLTAGTAGQVLTANGASTAPTWTTPAATGANTALSNLASVAINSDLIFGSTVVGVFKTKNVTGGSDSTALSITTGTALTTSSGVLTVATGSADGAVASGVVNINSGATAAAVSGAINVITGASSSTAGSTGVLNLKSGATGAASSGATGAVNISSGIAATNGGFATNNTGSVNISTGAVELGTSGSIVLTPGAKTGAGVRGKIKFVDGSEGTSGHIWTSTDTAGNGHWAVPATAGTITALTGMVTASGTGSVTATVVTNANLTGPITSVGNATSVTNLAITNAMIANSTIDLAAKVTGILPLLNGGTGTAATVKADAFAALAPITTTGDMIYSSAATLSVRLAIGTNGQVLKSNGTIPVWSADTGMVNPMTTGGDIIYGGSAGVATRLANGTAGQILTSAGTTLAPTWSNPVAGNLTGPVTSVGLATAIANGAISNAMLANADVANLSGTNTGDNATNSQYSGLVSNATHTGDATGATALTVVAINGTNMAALATGILKNTTTTGIPSIAIAADFPTLNQNTSGNAATVTTNANLTGPVTSTGNATAIANGAISNAMLANAAVANLSGTNTGDQTNITGNAATVTTNANLTGPVTSTGNATAIANGAISNAMLANGAVANLSGTNTGDQTNITGNAATVTTNANLTGDVTSTGNATTYNGTVPLNKGGTGQTTKAPAFDALSPMTAVGDLILGSTAGTGIRLAIGTNAYVLTSNGTTAAWAASASGFADPMTTRGDIIIRNAANATARLGIGANTYVLGSDGTDISWVAPGLTNPMTTGGDLIYGGAAGTPTRLANGSAGQLLQSNGTTTAPTWITPPTVPYIVTTGVTTSTLSGTDKQVITTDDSAGIVTLTLPAASTPNIGLSYRIKKGSASNTTVITRAGADTIDGGTTTTLTLQYETVDIICLTATTWGVF